VASEVWHSRSNAKWQAACNPRVLARGLDRIIAVRRARLARLTGHASGDETGGGKPCLRDGWSRHGSEAAAPPILLRMSVPATGCSRAYQGCLLPGISHASSKAGTGRTEGCGGVGGGGEEFPRRLQDVRPLSRRKHDDIVGVAKGGKRGTPGVLLVLWVQWPGKKDCRRGPVLMRGERGVGDDVAGNGINHRCQGRGSAGGPGPIRHLIALV
jgi:hypothetical protein